uniref:Uncharacterized protein n=1 Tax=Globodera pallida TaxID=36090 RepID=A0A183BJ90_GLOPA
MFATDKGESEVITGGLITFNGTQNRGWNLLAWVCCIFLVYVSLFGYLAQFIYRYLVLNRDKKLSTFKYFILASSAQTVKMVEMNKQISRNLIIQASMPFFIYFITTYFRVFRCFYRLL